MDERDTPMISVVDDDGSLRRALRNLRTSAGFHVETFPAAEEFLRSAQREKVSGLVLDLRMNGMNGLDLLRHLSAEHSGIPVVVISAHSDEDTRRQSLEAGAIAFLEKPFLGDALLNALRTALHGHGNDLSRRRI